MMIVSGVLRTMLTYAVPMVRNEATGEIRNRARIVPRMNAPTASP